MTFYTVTNTFREGEISTERYQHIWRNIIERTEQISKKLIDKNTASMV